MKREYPNFVKSRW